jgi:hypothetical protein
MSDKASNEYASTQVVPARPALYDKHDDAYLDHMLEQYKVFVDVTLQYWKHIESANNFFLTLHTAIVSAFTFLLIRKVEVPKALVPLLVTMSCAVALQWFLLLRSLQKLNRSMHEIIQEWEKQLPAQPHRVEYYKLFQRGPRYFKIQKLYTFIPILALAAYLAFGVLIFLGIKLVGQ